MKKVSVYLMTHDLGMNFNSDLCCLKGLSVTLENGHGSFERKRFWEGFSAEKNGKNHYYIGLPEQPFAPELRQIQLEGNPEGVELKLINMTLFPVAFEKVEPKDEDGLTQQPHGSNDANKKTGGNTVGGSAVPNDAPTHPTDQSDIPDVEDVK